MKCAGCSTREIAQRLGIARNTVRPYLNTPEALVPTLRKRRASKLRPSWSVMVASKRPLRWNSTRDRSPSAPGDIEAASL